jgi:hypothetical protein
MPYGKSYANEPAPGVPKSQRRQAGTRVSYNNTKLQPRRGPANGKFGGLPGGPSGGTMGAGGKT